MESLIPPATRVTRIINALRVGLVGFEDYNFDLHQEAVHRLFDLEEHELANALIARWKNASELEKEDAKRIQLATTGARV